MSFDCFDDDCFSFITPPLPPPVDSLRLNVICLNLVKVADASDLDLCLDCGGGVPTTGAPSRYMTSFPNDTFEALVDLEGLVLFPVGSSSDIALPAFSNDILFAFDDLLLVTLLQLDEPLEPPPAASIEILCLSNGFLGTTSTSLEKKVSFEKSALSEKQFWQYAIRC